MKIFKGLLQVFRIRPVIVQEKNTYILERFGKFHGVLSPGFNMIIPMVDRIAYRHSLKQQSIDIMQQTAITKDNVSLQIDGILFLMIEDPIKASYQIEDPKGSLKLLAVTMMRSEIGKLKLDQLLQERDKINKQINNAVNNAAKQWGIKCLRYEILNIQPPEQVKRSMEYEVQAQRNKRRQILISEGQQISKINEETGKKQSAIYLAEGGAESIRIISRMQKQTNQLLNKVLDNKIVKDYILLNKYLENYGDILKDSNVIAGPKSQSNMIALAMLANLRNNSNNSPPIQTISQTPASPQLTQSKAATQKKKYDQEILNSSEEEK